MVMKLARVDGGSSRVIRKGKLAKDIAIFTKTKRILTNNKLDFFTINYEALKNQTTKKSKNYLKKLAYI